jgi:hypothetical protein
MRSRSPVNNKGKGNVKNINNRLYCKNKSSTYILGKFVE